MRSSGSMVAGVGADVDDPAVAVQGLQRLERQLLRGLGLLALAGFAVLGLDVEVSVLLTTASFSLVYVVGCAAAVRLLPRGTWAHRAAVIALVAVTGLLVLTGVYVVGALIVAGAALAYDAYANRRR